MNQAGAPRAPVTPTQHVLAIAAAKSKAVRSGSKGEQIVAAYNAVAARRGVATLHKVPTEKRMVRRGKALVLMHTKRSTVDFVGFRHRDGVHAALEVKRCTTKTRFNLKEVEDHQRDYLTAVDAAGGIAYLVVVWGEPSKVCLVPWCCAAPRVSLSAAELDAYAVSAEQYATRLELAVAEHDERIPVAAVV